VLPARQLLTLPRHGDTHTLLALTSITATAGQDARPLADSLMRKSQVCLLNLNWPDLGDQFVPVRLEELDKSSTNSSAIS
jgi:hypothetical protein